MTGLPILCGAQARPGIVAGSQRVRGLPAGAGCFAPEVLPLGHARGPRRLPTVLRTVDAGAPVDQVGGQPPEGFRVISVGWGAAFAAAAAVEQVGGEPTPRGRDRSRPHQRRRDCGSSRHRCALDLGLSTSPRHGAGRRGRDLRLGRRVDPPPATWSRSRLREPCLRSRPASRSAANHRDGLRSRFWSRSAASHRGSAAPFTGAAEPSRRRDAASKRPLGRRPLRAQSRWDRGRGGGRERGADRRADRTVRCLDRERRCASGLRPGRAVPTPWRRSPRSAPGRVGGRGQRQLPRRDRLRGCGDRVTGPDVRPRR